MHSKEDLFFDLLLLKIFLKSHSQSMEPFSSPPKDSLEKKNPMSEPSQTEESQQGLSMHRVECFMTNVNETATSILEFAHQWGDYKKQMKLYEDFIRKQFLELEKREGTLKLKEEEIEEKIKVLGLKEKELEERATRYMD